MVKKQDDIPFDEFVILLIEGKVPQVHSERHINNFVDSSDGKIKKTIECNNIVSFRKRYEEIINKCHYLRGDAHFYFSFICLISDSQGCRWEQIQIYFGKIRQYIIDNKLLEHRKKIVRENNLDLVYSRFEILDL